MKSPVLPESATEPIFGDTDARCKPAREPLLAELALDLEHLVDGLRVVRPHRSVSAVSLERPVEVSRGLVRETEVREEERALRLPREPVAQHLRRALRTP